MPYIPISDHGIIGGAHSAGVVGLGGSINCLCCPRVDYARGGGKQRSAPDGFVAERDKARIALASPINVIFQSDAATGGFTLPQEDQRVNAPSGKKEVP
jgi:hypothetical protein